MSNVKTLCGLPASGFTNTTKDAWTWAEGVANEARKILKGNINVKVWAYREQETECLSCDFSDEHGNIYPITLQAVGEHDFSFGDPYVPDMAEAMHMAGIVIRNMSAHIEIGQHKNEINEDVLSRPLLQEETNGKIKLM